MNVRQWTDVGRIALLFSVFSAWIALSGCAPKAEQARRPADRVTQDDKAPDPGKAARSGESRKEPPQQAAEQTWRALFIEGHKVGYSEQKNVHYQQGSQTRIRREVSEHLSLARFGQPHEVHGDLWCVTTEDGRLVEFTYEIPLGKDTSSEVHGWVEDGRLIVQTATGDRTRRETFAVPEQLGGLFAPEHSLRQQPLQPGEERSLTMVQQPPFEQVGTVKLMAEEYGPTQLLSGTFKLLEVRCEAELSFGGQLARTFWTDREGNILKEEFDLAPQLSIQAYRTTREVALAESSPQAFDIGLDLSIPLAEPLDDPHGARRAVYRVAMEDGDPSEHFPSGAGQEVAPLDEHTAQITVRGVRPSGDERESADDAPGAADSSASEFIDSDQPAVRDLAARVEPDEKDAWKLARALEQFVHRYVEEKDYSQAFSRASDVVRCRSGDCSEHAVLLAALCRSRDIPARVAMGLVYTRQVGGFAFHMWTEVWIDGQWIPLDATRARGGTGAGHLKLQHSSLAGPAAYTTILPVLQVVGRLKVELVEKPS